MFWNVRGLGTAHRRGLVLKHVIQENLDIVGIQETIRQDFNDQELKDISGTFDFAWKWNPAKCHSGGLLLGGEIREF
jgi:exonuclease III